MNTIYIIMPVHNRIIATKRFVECLKTQTFQNYHLILIDDGSTDGTSEMVKFKVSNLTIIKGNGNLFFGGALQKGFDWMKKIKANDDDIVLIINNDTEFESNYLENAKKIIDNSSNTLLISICYERTTRKLMDIGTHIEWKRLVFTQAEKPNQINCTTTRGLFLKYKDFIAIGGFYPHLLPHYSSDYEYTVRAYRKGYRLIVDEKVKVWTDESNKPPLDLQNMTLFQYFKRILSKRYYLNPYTLIIFVMLACPGRYIIGNIVRILGLVMIRAIKVLWYQELKKTNTKTSLVRFFEKLFTILEPFTEGHSKHLKL